jgi:glycosyltransferase involved in cell wall biosynthesis
MMHVRNEPLVSVVTPVYNGEAFLRECIDSVLAQTYQNWEYVIVNNCSKDRTLEIAQEYAARDRRIRVSTNTEFLPIIANHNAAFRLISAESGYCKVVSADDWIFPECLEKMVGLAAANPSVGLVGAYQLSGGGDQWYVRNDGLPFQRKVINGREMGRSHLLPPHPLDVFGNPTSSMYRADLVRASEAFYPNDTAEADRSACFMILQRSDYGFVHQVLAYERLHNARVTKTSQAMNAYLSSRINDCHRYGAAFLTPEEKQACLQDLLDEYYRFLASSVVTGRWGKGFWSYHSHRLREVGHPIQGAKLSKAVAVKLLGAAGNPSRSIARLREVR